MLKDPFWKSVYISLAMIIGSFIAAAGILYVSISEIEVNAMMIEQARGEEARRSKLIEAIARSKQDSKEVDAYSSLIAQVFPTKDEFINFPTWLRTFAGPYGVEITFSFSNSNQVPAAGQPGFAGFSLRVAGPPEKVSAFILSLENKSPKYVLSLDNADIVVDSNQMFFTSSGKLYYRQGS